MSDLQRREWLKVAGGCLTMAGIAGCAGPVGDGGSGGGSGDGTSGGSGSGGGGSGGSGDGGGDGSGDGGSDGSFGGDESIPSYASQLWQPESAPAASPAVYISADASALVSSGSTPTPTATSTPTAEPPNDALVTNISIAMFVLAFGTFSLQQVGLGKATGSNQSTPDPEDVPADRVTMPPDGGIVVSGSFDAETLSATVEEAGLSETETSGEFTVYEADGKAAAISSELLVASTSSGDDGEPTAIEEVQNAVGAYTGGQPYHEADEDVAWAHRTVGETLVEMGLFTRDDAMATATPTPTPTGGGGSNFAFATELYAGAKGMIQSIDADSMQGSITAEAALFYASEDAVDTGQIESVAGTRATDRDVRHSGRKVAVEANYDSFS